MTLSRRATIGVLVGVFLIAFALRAHRPLSKPSGWLDRSAAFNVAIDTHDWASTFQRGHPGFTVMVFGGTAMRLYDAAKGTPAGVLFDWAVPPYATEYGREMAAGVLGLAFVIAGLTVAATLVLRRLGDWALALTAGGLLTFSPFYLSQSRVFHPEGLVSALMLLSAVLLLVSLESGQRRYLLLSGFVGGLAVLTKTPSVFLIPFTGLALLAHLVVRVRAAWPGHSEGRMRWLVREAWRGLVCPGLLWLLMAAVPFALWPVMWVRPLDTLQRMTGGVRYRLAEGHYRRFFAGQIYENVRPPIWFYPTTLVLKSSFLTLTLGLVAVGHYTLWRRRGKPPLRPITFWLLVAFVFFFMLQMAVGFDQTSRYVLPASLVLEVLAAVGLGGLVELLGRAAVGRGSKLMRALPTALIAIAVGLQALVALPYAPDYGAHHNHLLGGNRVAVSLIEILEQQEGILYVADYLSRQPEADALQIGTSESTGKVLDQYFSGVLRQNLTPKDDYHLLTIKDLQRGSERGEKAQAIYEESPPQLLVIIDGVEYVRLYATQPTTPYNPIVIRRGGGTGFIVLAWVWTVALGAALVWALGRKPHDVSVPVGG